MKFAGKKPLVDHPVLAPSLNKIRHHLVPEHLREPDAATRIESATYTLMSYAIIGAETRARAKLASDESVKTRRKNADARNAVMCRMAKALKAAGRDLRNIPAIVAKQHGLTTRYTRDILQDAGILPRKQ